MRLPEQALSSEDEMETAARNRRGSRPYLKRVTRHTVWLGATDKAIEGSWKTVTGEPLSHENGSPEEPNDYGQGEDCLAYRSGKENWNDRGCQSRLHFVCERPEPR
jgi:hypothetical protein